MDESRPDVESRRAVGGRTAGRVDAAASTKSRLRLRRKTQLLQEVRWEQRWRQVQHQKRLQKHARSCLSVRPRFAVTVDTGELKFADCLLKSPSRTYQTSESVQISLK